jgi:hypothetical protein
MRPISGTPTVIDYRIRCPLPPDPMGSKDRVTAQTTSRGKPHMHLLLPVITSSPGSPALCPIESEVSCFDSR